MSYKGTVYKSYEGELACIGQRTMTDKEGHAVGTTGNIWSFSVPDKPEYKAVVAALQKARRSGRRVDLEYEQVRLKGFNTDTDYYVTCVNFVDDNGNVTESTKKSGG